MSARRHRGLFGKFSQWASRWTGHGVTFSLAVALILGWALSGPLFGFSDTWQLMINTATTLVTFLMVFVIQNTQMRDMEAMQVKVDEVIRATSGARNDLLDVEELSEKRLREIKRGFSTMAARSRDRGRPKRRRDTATRLVAPEASVPGRSSRRRPRGT